MNTNVEVGFLLFPNLTQLDLTGPAQVLSRLPNAKVHLVWKDLGPVMSHSTRCIPLVPLVYIKIFPNIINLIF